jgi:hypothetical protein
MVAHLGERVTCSGDLHRDECCPRECMKPKLVCLDEAATVGSQ